MQNEVFDLSRFFTFFCAPKSVVKMGFLAKMGHRAAKKSHRPAFFAPMYPPHDPGGLGSDLGPGR